MHKRRIFPGQVCEDCHAELEDFVVASAIGMQTDVDPPPEFGDCDLCGERLGGQAYYELTGVTCSAEIVTDLRKHFFACERDGCGRRTDGDDEVFDDTNDELLNIFGQLVDDLDGGNAYERVLKWAAEFGELEAIQFPEIACPKCNQPLAGWFDDVQVELLKLLIPEVPSLPKEISNVPTAASDPADVIEFFRSDCSNSLVHVTKPATIEHLESQHSEKRFSKHYESREVLYLILATRKLKAHKGAGLHASAVCFTEKPLTALKDTLLGHESQERKRRKALLWDSYGLMFSKDYLWSLGARPVLHLSADEEKTLNKELVHRVVPLSRRSNWVHEREWRCGGDLDFDPQQAIVLVPRFEQIAPFDAALGKVGVKVRGFLPLLDLFACM